MKNGGVGSVWRMVKSDRLGWGSRPVGKRFALRVLFATLLALASGVPPSFAGEYDCMVMGLGTLGTVFLSADCTMTGEIDVSGDLTVTGQETVYSTLTAASDKRHFTITSGAYRVSLKWLNMTGGNVNAGYTASGNVESSRSGGIYVYNVAADLIISHCVFFRNHAASGGAVSAVGAVSAQFRPTLLFSSVLFESNIASYMGGGLYLERATFEGVSNTFVRNTATTIGGAIGTRPGAVISSTNSSFRKNYAKRRGGAIGIHDTQLNLTRVELTENKQTLLGPVYYGGGGLYLYSKVTANIRECLFVNNEATQQSSDVEHGGQIMIVIMSSGTPSITVVNTKFTNLPGVNPFFGWDGVSGSDGPGIYVEPTTCTLNPCSAPPFTGDCFSSASPNQGVICDPPACPTGSYNQFLSTPLPPPLAMPCGETMPEFSCSKLPTRGVYQRSQDCTLEGEVHVSGDLSLTGQETVYSTLTAASGKRHFRITSGAHTLRLKWLNMTGGDIPTPNSGGSNSGGSIHVKDVAARLNISHCVFYNNRAFSGGAVYVSGGHTSLFFSSVVFESNTAVVHGGGVHLYEGTYGGESNTFVRNTANAGGAIYASDGDINGYREGTVVSSTNSLFKKNSAVRKAGAIFITNSLLDLTKVELTENKQTNEGTTGTNGGGGLYLSNKVTANIRECLFVNNEATQQSSDVEHGGQIMIVIMSSGTPSITVVNTKFTNLPGVNPFFGLDEVSGSDGPGIYVEPTTCTLNPCSAPPFTGDCLSSIDPNQGVICDPPACPTGSYNQFLSTPLPPPLAMPCGETIPEFSCSKLPTRGVYQRSQDCTLEGEVHVSGDLSVTGQETVYSTLTAKSGARHFRITSGAHTLRLKWLRMTGGDVSGYGGSIFVRNVNAILNISHCVFSSNHAAHGGAVFTLQGQPTLFFSHVLFELNTATVSGGAVYLERATFQGEEVIFDRNTGKYGGAIGVLPGSIFSITHSTFINNNAEFKGGAMYVEGDSTKPSQLNLTRVLLAENTQTGGGTWLDRGGGGLALHSRATANIRECTFVKNKATTGLVEQKHGHQIMTRKSNAGIPSITVVNTNFTDLAGSYPFYGYDLTTNTAGEDKYVTPTACASNPCSASPFTGECFNLSAGVLCGIADDYSPACSWGQVKANVSTALLPPQLCECPENLYFNGTACLPAPIITSMTPKVALPDSTHHVSFVGSFEGTIIDLSIGRGNWTSITRVSSTNITAIPPTGIAGQLYQLYVTVNGIRALAAFNFSYVAPNITQVISPPFAGGTVKVLGHHFGSILDELTISVSGKGACAVSCEEKQWIDGGVACQYNARGTKDLEMDVRVTVGPKGHEQPSNLAGYQYDFDKGTLTGILEGRQRVLEGANLTYRLALTTGIAPKQDNVTVLLIASRCTVFPTAVTFLVNQDQTYSVVVGTVNNKVDEGEDIAYFCTVIHTIKTTDRQYRDNIDKKLEIDVLNDDEAGMMLGTLKSGGAHAYSSKVLSFYMEEGGTSEYLITLDTEPSANVSVHLNITIREAAVHAPEVVAVPSVVHFSPSLWKLSRAIRIQSIDDNIDYPLTEFEVFHTVVSADGVFEKKINAQRVVALLQVNDNDTAGVRFASDAPLTILEGGRPGSINISRLMSEPLSDVYVYVDMPQGGLELVSESPIAIQRLSWAKVGRTIDVRAPGGAFNAAGENTIDLQLRLESQDARYNGAITANMIIIQPSIDSVPPPSQPTIAVGSNLFLMVLKWNDKSNVSNYEVQWGENREFANEANITWTDRTEIELKVPNSLATTVVYSRVRKVLGSGETGAWSVVSTAWTTTGSCDYTRQYLNASSKNPLMWQARECPEGASCEGDITWDGAKALFGWWRHTPGPHLSKFSKCLFPPACLGAKNPVFEKSFFMNDGSNPATVDHNESCNVEIGYAASCSREVKGRCRLCGTCKSGYRRRELGSATRCDKCPEGGANTVLMACGVLLAVLMLSVLLVQHIKKGGKRSLTSMRKVIIINYFQLMYMIASLDVPWPEPLQILFDVEGAVSTIGEHLLNPECEVTGISAAEMIYFKQVAYVFSLPALISLSRVFWYAHAWWQGRAFRYRGADGRSPSHKDGSVATVVFLLYLLYPTLCRQAFALLSCKSIGSKSFMLMDLQEECWTGRHLHYFVLCTLPQILFHVIGIPLIGLYIVRRSMIGKARKRHPAISMFRYGMLYCSYREKRWYWAAVVASRKAIIAFITRTPLLEDPSLEIHWIIMYLSASVMANLVARQHIGADGISRKSAKMLQLLDSTSLFLLLFTAWSGLFFNLSPYCGEGEAFCALTLAVVFLVNLLFFLYCMFLLRTYITGGLKVICSIFMKGKTAKGGIRGSEGRGQGIHANPLIYRRTLVEKHETKNPLQLFEGEGSGAQGPVRFHPPPGLKKQPSNLVIELRQLRRHNSADRSRRLNRLASLRKRTDQERAETRSTSLPSKADDTVSSDNGVGWEVYVDSESGDFYYYNNVSNETTWERPPGVDPSFFHEKEKQLFQEV